MNRWLIAGLIALCSMIVPAGAQSMHGSRGEGDPVTVQLSDHGGTLVKSLYSETFLYPLTNEAGDATECADGLNGWCVQSFTFTTSLTDWPFGAFSEKQWWATYRAADGTVITVESSDFNGVVTYDNFTASFTATDSLGRLCSGGMSRGVGHRAVYRGYQWYLAAGATWLTCE